ncbi:MAG: hypothetical protein Q8P29_02510 [Candidatus Levybacteria bacterium]|nr:hypothetical protein [Candidatus Levybacteria bacterium]
MGNWAEGMIVKEVQKASKIKQEEIALQDKINQEKQHEKSILALRLFSSYRYIESERFWSFLAYAYFVCKTIGLLFLIGLLFFGKLHTIFFIIIFLCCYYINLKFYKYISRRKIKINP